jgi:hypothetical protein
MNSADALRFVAHEAAWCRNKDEAEALCLLFPALCKAAGVEPMNGYEADAFRAELKEWLRAEADRLHVEKERTRI